MRARLACFTGKMRGESFELEREATIGRGLGNTIVLDDGEISTEHARIHFDDERGCYLLEDLESLNGTQVDGVRVLRPEPLTGLHVVTFAGDLDFVFQPLAAAESAPQEDAEGGRGEDEGETEAGGQSAAPDDAGPAAGPVLAVTTEQGELRFPLAEGVQEVGRGPTAAIRLESGEISRRHARITLRGGRVLIADLDSRNHTFVDGRRLTAEEEVAPGARLRFGDLRATLLPR